MYTNKILDTPDEIGIHLVTALGCVPTDPKLQRQEQQQLKQIIFDLQSEKRMLSTELHQLNTRLNRLPHIDKLTQEIGFINSLISQLEIENSRARDHGLSNLEHMVSEYTRIQHETSDFMVYNKQVSEAFEQQLQQNQALKSELEVLIMKIRTIHSTNNELVNTFG